MIKETTENEVEQEQEELTLKNDVIFQAFFAKKGNEEYLIDFLNAVLKIEITQIEIRQEVSLEKISKEEKGGRLDIQAYVNDGTIVNVEMQMKNESNMKQRTKYYGASEVKYESISKGEDYQEMKDVIMINILGYDMFEYDEYVSDTVIVLDKHREEEAITGLKWYFIELAKFRRTHPNMDEKINQWLAFIDNYDRGLVKMAEEKNKTIQKARVEMDCLTGDAEVKRLAFLREKWELDRISAINQAKRERKRRGRSKGKKRNCKKAIKIRYRHRNY